MPFSVMANPVILMNGTSSPAAIFDEDNVLPGDTIISSISLVSDNSYLLATRAIVDLNSDFELADKMTLRIVEANLGHVYFSGTLQAFFSSPEVSLATVLHGESRQFDFIVYFDETTSDDMYQEMNLVFDIAIGFGPGPGYTGSISIEDQFLAAEASLAENVTIVKESNIFKKDTTWQVFASAFTITSSNFNGNNGIINDGFSSTELMMVILFVGLFFITSYLLKRRSV